MTGRNDVFLHPDVSMNPGDSLIGALKKWSWSCYPVSNYKECKCACGAAKFVTSMLGKNPKDPWNDPTFPFRPIYPRGTPNDQINGIHAIRANSGCSQNYTEIPHTFDPGPGIRQPISPEDLEGYFGGRFRLLCCCQDSVFSNQDWRFK